MHQRSIALLLLAALTGLAGWARTPAAAVHASSRAPISITLDNVPLLIQNAALPSETFAVSQAGSASQMATWAAWQPFREFSITTVPFGRKPPTEELPAAVPGGVGSYRTALRDFRTQQGGKVQDGPTAMLFGKPITGTRSTVMLPIDAGSEKTVVVDEWAVQAGNRLWIVRASQEQLPDAPATPPDFASGLLIDSSDPDQPSTVDDEAGQPVPHTLAVTTAAANLPTPTWWNGDCDYNTYLAGAKTGSYRLGAVYLGMPACGPRPWADGAKDVLVRFYSGAWGVYEWECVELAMRFMYLKWGIAPYGANGKDVVNNYTGTLLVKISNGTVGKAPKPNDVLSYGPTSQYGHSSVVSASNVDANGNGTITVIEENAAASGSSTLSVSNWKVSAFSTISGWLHDPSADGPPNSSMSIGGITMGSYYLPEGGSLRQSYSGTANGPVKAYSLDGTTKLIAAKRSVWVQNGLTTSYSEMMGLPKEQLSSEYYFPWYNNTAPTLLNEQFRITNVDGTGTTVEVYAGGSLQDSFWLPAGFTAMPDYNIDTGPIRIRSADGKKLTASLRALWLKGNGINSYGEIMGIPKEQLSTEYYFPWYNDTAPTLLDEQLRFGNVDTTATTVRVYAGSSLIGSYDLDPGESMRQAYPTVDNGPLRVVSTNGRKIIAAIRAVWLTNGQFSSYNELMGLPKEQLATEYWLPWYNNTVPSLLDEQLRFGNTDAASTTVEVTIGTTLVGRYPLGIGESTRQAFAIDDGPVHVRSTDGRKIIASIRAVWLKGGVWNSYAELMGLPAPLLSAEYWFPWYDFASPSTLDEQLRFGRP